MASKQERHDRLRAEQAIRPSRDTKVIRKIDQNLPSFAYRANDVSNHRSTKSGAEQHFRR